MGLSTFRQKLLEQIIAECGDACHYCRKQTRLNFTTSVNAPDHATLDHVVPKSKGGTNDRSNLVLACNACNNAKSDRSYDDFVERPYRLRRPPAVTVEKSRAIKACKGTLAAAINSGEVEPHGMYARTPARQLQPEPRERITPLPYHETMWILTGKKVRREDFFENR